MASAVATMRDSATRALFSLMPNRPATCTNWATGSAGGSAPRKVLASTERAVSGLSSSSCSGATALGTKEDYRSGITYLCHPQDICNTAPMTATMVADPTARPEVLPTERLLPTGVPRPEIRADLRRIDDFGNARSVVFVWAWVVSMVWFCIWSGSPFAYAAAFILMGPVYARFAILMHEAAHKLLFTNKRVNDWVGTWVIAYPAWTPVGLYRRAHFAHHREEFGPDEPDIAFYGGYPCTKKKLRQRLLRDAIGISGWKNFKSLVGA